MYPNTVNKTGNGIPRSNARFVRKFRVLKKKKKPCSRSITRFRCSANKFGRIRQIRRNCGIRSKRNSNRFNGARRAFFFFCERLQNNPRFVLNKARCENNYKIVLHSHYFSGRYARGTLKTPFY